MVGWFLLQFFFIINIKKGFEEAKKNCIKLKTSFIEKRKIQFSNLRKLHISKSIETSTLLQYIMFRGSLENKFNPKIF